MLGSEVLPASRSGQLEPGEPPSGQARTVSQVSLPSMHAQSKSPGCMHGILALLVSSLIHVTLPQGPSVSTPLPSSKRQGHAFQGVARITQSHGGKHARPPSHDGEVLPTLACSLLLHDSA